MKNNTHPTQNPWLVICIASLFFFYEFIQMSMFNAIADDLMRAFHINATTLSQISSLYFIANVIFLFVSGWVLDRYSIRNVIIIALGLCIMGTALFATTISVYWAGFFRFLTGIGSAFCFLSCIRLATHWFPPKRLAFVTGIIVTIAMAGGIAAQTPLTALAKSLNWRMALLVNASVGSIILALIIYFVKDYPSIKHDEYHLEKASLKTLGTLKSIKKSFLNFENWRVGFYTSCMNVPLSILGGIWGMTYLKITYHLAQIQASYITTLLFVGMIIGSPLSGYISDHLELRRLPMLCGAGLLFFLILFIFFFPQHSLLVLILCFFAIGIVSGTQVLGYPTAAEKCLPAITAMSVSLVNIATQTGQAIVQPIFGWLMDLHSKSFHSIGFKAADFNWAIWIFPIMIIVAFILAFLIKETHARRI